MMPNKQSGQTLIETMVAMFILVMGIGAAFGLATYALSSTSGITNQVIGMGLAREGIEVVKNMRDTNWLNTALSVGVIGTGGTATGGCYDFQNFGRASGLCYQNWLGATSGNAGRIIYNIDPGTSSKFYFLSFLSGNNGNSDQNFELTAVDTAASSKYKVYETSSPVRYSQASSKPSGWAETAFNRRVTLTKNSTGVFSYSTGPALKVTVDVWWSQKNCPASTSPDALPQSCKITLETYLTNWKTY